MRHYLAWSFAKLLPYRLAGLPAFALSPWSELLVLFGYVQTNEAFVFKPEEFLKAVRKDLIVPVDE
jgi:hypothetical protein